MDGVWILIVFVCVIFFLFPVFLTVNVFCDVKAKKIYFSLSVYHIFKVYGGYATIYDEGIAFHLTKKTAALLPFNEIINTRKKFEITKGFYLFAYSQVIELGIEEAPGYAMYAAAAVQIVSSIVSSYLHVKKKSASFKSDILLREAETLLKVSLRAVLMFNFLILIIAAIKILLQKLLEKVAEYERKKQKSK